MKSTNSDGLNWQHWWLAALVVALATSPAAAEEIRPPLKIVNGQDATYGDYPYIVSLQLASGGSWYHICGGIIWNHDYVVTAAHCLSNAASSYRIVAGEHRISGVDTYETFHSVASYTRHPNYMGSASGYPNDIAYMRLATPLTYNSHVRGGRFAEPNDNITGQAWLSGWGRLVGGGAAANALQEVQLPQISNTECASRWAGISGASINSGHICFYQGTGFSACNGDSGGPAEANGRNAGVTSWGIDTCSGSYPSVYTRVSVFYSWLTNGAGANDWIN